MRRLVLAFAGRTYQIVVNLMSWLICVSILQGNRLWKELSTRQVLHKVVRFLKSGIAFNIDLHFCEHLQVILSNIQKQIQTNGTAEDEQNVNEMHLSWAYRYLLGRAVGSESDCRSRGFEFDSGQVPYFGGD